MKEIFCPVDLYVVKQKFYNIDTEREQVAIELGETTVDNFPCVLIEACEKENINKIHLAGNESYLKSIAENIKTYSVTKYHNTKKEIEIEVN